jgi:phospholipid/cholesterol/gamma-HCH transport system substrate-binding protein
MAEGRARGLYWSQLKIGVVVTLTVLAVALLVFFIDEVGSAIENRYTLYFHTLTTETLRLRAPVWLAGQRVGHVEALSFEPPTAERTKRLRVELSVSEDVQKYITEGSVAQVINAGLLGEAVVNIQPGEMPGKPVAANAELPTAKELDIVGMTGQMKGLMDSVGPVVARLLDVTEQAERGDGTLGRLARDPEQLIRWHDQMAHISSTFHMVQEIGQRLDRVLADAETRESIERVYSRLERLQERWEEGGGSADALVNDTALASHLERISESMEAIGARLRNGDGTLGRVLHDSALTQAMAETMRMVAELRENLARRGGAGPPPR